MYVCKFVFVAGGTFKNHSHQPLHLTFNVTSKIKFKMRGRKRKIPEDFIMQGWLSSSDDEDVLQPVEVLRGLHREAILQQEGHAEEDLHQPPHQLQEPGIPRNSSEDERMNPEQLGDDPQLPDQGREGLLEDDLEYDEEDINFMESSSSEGRQQC